MKSWTYVRFTSPSDYRKRPPNASLWHPDCKLGTLLHPYPVQTCEPDNTVILRGFLLLCWSKLISLTHDMLVDDAVTN